MCGRYALSASGAEILRHFGTASRYAGFDEFAPRYNIAPGQTLPIVRARDHGPEIVAAQWGLIPFWAHDRKLAAQMFNARAERIVVQPAFRSAFKRRRCLVPANGFFQWKATGGGPHPIKRPYFFSLAERTLFAFAGIWERWTSAQGEVVTSFAIVTTDANATVRPIDERMPVIVRPEHYARWLGIDRDPAFALTLVEPTPPGLLKATPVSTAVNNASHDSVDCIAPAGADADR